MNVTVIGLAKDNGSIVLFDGVSAQGEIRFAVEHREAQAIISALEAGEHVEVDIESWQITS